MNAVKNRSHHQFHNLATKFFNADLKKQNLNNSIAELKVKIEV